MKTSMVPKPAKDLQIQPNRGLYTPEPVRGRVIARHITGHSNRRIAKDEGIDRETVGRILSQKHVVQMLAQYQSQLLTMVPKAIGVYDEALASQDLRLATATATKLLEGLQVLNKSGPEQAIENANRASPEVEQENRRCLLLGQFVQMALEKKRYYEIASPELDALETEFAGFSADAGPISAS